MAMTEMTYKGRRIWIDPYVVAHGWQAKAEAWEVGKEGLFKDEIKLPANYTFRTERSAYAFMERITKRGIDRRQEQEGIVNLFALMPDQRKREESLPIYSLRRPGLEA
jgi:hypothetical protein